MCCREGLLTWTCAMENRSWLAPPLEVVWVVARREPFPAGMGDFNGYRRQFTCRRSPLARNSQNVVKLTDHARLGTRERSQPAVVLHHRVFLLSNPLVMSVTVVSLVSDQVSPARGCVIGSRMGQMCQCVGSRMGQMCHCVVGSRMGQMCQCVGSRMGQMCQCVVGSRMGQMCHCVVGSRMGQICQSVCRWVADGSDVSVCRWVTDRSDVSLCRWVTRRG